MSTTYGNPPSLTGQDVRFSNDDFTVDLSDGRTITTIAYPTSVAFDRDGYLWVADNGPDQNFKIFSVPATGGPIQVATFGETGGVFARPLPGEAGPLRFWGPRGVGFGDKGEIIVGCSGIPGQDVGVGGIKLISDVLQLVIGIERRLAAHGRHLGCAS